MIFKDLLDLHNKIWSRKKKLQRILQLGKNLKTENKTAMNILKAVGSTVTSSFLDRPVYDVITKDKGVEERLYKAAKWVSTNVQGMEHESARSIGFRRLFKYIQGSNEQSMKIDMTSPVATRVTPGAGPNCENTFTVSFYIPEPLQNNPPQPTASDVFIEEWPERTILSRSFGGFAKEETWLNEAKHLTDVVSESQDKVSVNQNFWFTAGYNSPYQMFGRTNEVWFVKE